MAYQGRHRRSSKRKAAMSTIAVGGGVTLAATPFAALPAHADIPGVPARWEQVVRCESGGNPNIVNNTAAGIANDRPAGLYQIITGTWIANGGGRFAPTADQATPRQQLIIAEAVLRSQGPGAWACPGAPSSSTRVSGGSGGGGGGRHSYRADDTPGYNDTDCEPAEGENSSNSPDCRPKGKHHKSYVIQSGDTLSEIARKFGTSVTKLDRANSSINNPDVIYAGDRIRIR